MQRSATPSGSSSSLTGTSSISRWIRQSKVARLVKSILRSDPEPTLILGRVPQPSAVARITLARHVSLGNLLVAKDQNLHRARIGGARTCRGPMLEVVGTLAL